MFLEICYSLFASAFTYLQAGCFEHSLHQKYCTCRYRDKYRHKRITTLESKVPTELLLFVHGRDKRLQGCIILSRLLSVRLGGDVEMQTRLCSEGSRGRRCNPRRDILLDDEILGRVGSSTPTSRLVGLTRIDRLVSATFQLSLHLLSFLYLARRLRNTTGYLGDFERWGKYARQVNPKQCRG